MGVLPANRHDVECETRRRHEGAPKFLAELGIKRWVSEDLLPGKLDVVMQVWTTGEIERRLHQGLVERHGIRRKPAYTDLVTQGFRERSTKKDPGVLNGVMCIDVQISLGLHDEVEPAVATELIEHVVEEVQSGDAIGRSIAIEFDADLDLRLFGVPSSGCVSHSASVRNSR